MNRGDWIDYLLGELAPERRTEAEATLRADPEARREVDALREAIALARSAAADESWSAAPRARSWLRPAGAIAAAALLIAFGAFVFSQLRPARDAVYEPDGATGYLWPEETDARGGVPALEAHEAYFLRSGRVEASPIGGEPAHARKAGERIATETEVTCVEAAWVILEGGGALFLPAGATAQLRHRDDRAPAVRLIQGDAAFVAGSVPVHLAVDRTDLLLTLESGACVARQSRPDALCLRGALILERARGGRFRIPEGERLPAQCADSPITAPIDAGELELDWYFDLVYTTWEWHDVRWAARPSDGGAWRSDPVRAAPDTRLYLRAVPTKSGELSLSFGGEARTFRVVAGREIRLRLELASLGPGPALELRVPGAPSGLGAARVFRATPRGG